MIVYTGCKGICVKTISDDILKRLVNCFLKFSVLISVCIFGDDRPYRLCHARFILRADISADAFFKKCFLDRAALRVAENIVDDTESRVELLILAIGECNIPAEICFACRIFVLHN